MPDRPVALSPDRLHAPCDPACLPADSSADIDPGLDIIGQPRGAASIGFALGMAADGYNLFVAGEPGTGRNTSVRIAVDQLAAHRPIPDDWCYVHCFQQADTPRVLRLPAGRGTALQRDMEELVAELREEIPRAFEGKVHEERRAQLVKTYQDERDRLLETFKQEAGSRGFTVEQQGGGLLTLPARDGRALSSQEWEELSSEEQKEIEQRQEELHRLMRDLTRQVRDLEKEARGRLQELEREIARTPLDAAIDELRERYKDHPAVPAYLEEVREDILAHLDAFKEESEAPSPFPGIKITQSDDTFLRYKVNVLVDNSDAPSAPVIFETNPTFYNLVGRIEYRAQMGTMTTDFTMIKAGALHRANGGYLIVQALDLLRNPMSWDALKRAIRDRHVVLEDLNEQYRIVQTQGLKPEPVPLDIKVVLVGSPYLYALLFRYEEEFGKLFKVKAEFGGMMERDPDSISAYAGFISQRARTENLLDFDRSAMARVIEYGSRLVGDQRKLSTRFIEIADLLREADHWARLSGAPRVTAAHIHEAIEHKRYRSNRIEERLRDLIGEGTLLVSVDGRAEGQINGLTIIDVGDYRFGKPTRLTARVYAGKGGIVQIDRDTRMAGSVHNKGLMILQGFFGERFARKTPVSFSASLTFEQIYDGIEGDSASTTELYCLLSALARVPLRQDLAVTGSVNQFGELQAIGGVNEKIEGWFYTCRLIGLTGSQGVLIPAANVRHLMLHREVLEAVEQGRFHIYSIAHVDEGIELLTGMPAGSCNQDGSYPVGSLNYRIQKRLEVLNEGIRRTALPQGNQQPFIAGIDTGYPGRRR